MATSLPRNSTRAFVLLALASAAGHLLSVYWFERARMLSAVSGIPEMDVVARILARGNSEIRPLLLTGLALVIVGLLAAIRLPSREDRSTGGTKSLGIWFVALLVSLAISQANEALFSRAHRIRWGVPFLDDWSFTSAEILAILAPLGFGLAMLYSNRAVATVGRLRYLIAIPGLNLIFLLVILLGGSPRFILPVGICASLIGAPIVIRRLNEIGRPGWHYWLGLIPGYGVPYLGACLLFQRGREQAPGAAE
jgi:uncharacterized membrane protein YhaH (DUF805 family)